MRVPKEKERCAVISAYGSPCELLEKHLALQRVKKTREKYYLNSPLGDPKVQELAKIQGIVLRNDGHDYFTKQKSPASSTITQ